MRSSRLMALGLAVVAVGVGGCGHKKAGGSTSAGGSAGNAGASSAKPLRTSDVTLCFQAQLGHEGVHELDLTSEDDPTTRATRRFVDAGQTSGTLDLDFDDELRAEIRRVPTIEAVLFFKDEPSALAAQRRLATVAARDPQYHLGTEPPEQWHKATFTTFGNVLVWADGTMADNDGILRPKQRDILEQCFGRRAQGGTKSIGSL